MLLFLKTVHTHTHTHTLRLQYKCINPSFAWYNPLANIRNLIFANRLYAKMSEDIYAQFLRGEVTESAAATFTEGDAIPTGASVNRFQGNTVGIEVHEICCDLTMPQDLPSTGATEQVRFTLSTRTGLAAHPTIDERHVIYKNATQIKAGVGTYLPLIWTRDQFMDHNKRFAKPLLLAHPYLYPYVDSSNSSNAAVARWIITYNMVLLEGDLTLEALEAFRYGD